MKMRLFVRICVVRIVLRHGVRVWECQAAHDTYVSQTSLFRSRRAATREGATWRAYLVWGLRQIWELHSAS